MPFLVPSEQSDTPSSKRIRLSVEQTFESDNILPRQKTDNQSLSCNSQSNNSFSPRPGPSNSKVASHNFQSAGLSSTSQSHNHVPEGFSTMNEPLEAYDTHFNDHFPDGYSNMVEPEMNYSTHNVPIDLPGASVTDMTPFIPSMPFSSGGFPSIHEPTPSRLNEVPPPPGIHHQPASHNGVFTQLTNRMSNNNFPSRVGNNRQQIHVLPNTSMYYNSVLSQLYSPNYSNYERGRPQQCYCPSCDTPLLPYGMSHPQCRQSRAPMLSSYGHASSSNLRNGYYPHHHHHYEGNNMTGFGLYNCNHMMQPPPSAPGPGPMQTNLQQSPTGSIWSERFCLQARATPTTQRRTTNVASSPSNFMAPTSTSSQSQPSNPNRSTHISSNHNHQHHISNPFRPNYQPSFYFPVNVSRQVGGVHPSTPTMPVGANRRVLPSNSTWVTNQPPPSISASVGGAPVAITPYPPTRPVIFTRGFPRPIMQPSTGVVLTVPASSQTLNVLNSAMARYSQDDVSATELHFNFGYENLISLAERLGDVKPQGLMKSQIDKLKSYVYQAGVTNSDQHTCVVCICEWEPDQKVRVLPCKHEFHAKCVDRWLKEDRTCPICRYEIKDDDSPPSN